MSNSYTYAIKANRDNKYNQLKSAGVAAIRRTASNQSLHPMYVDDANETEHANAAKDTGFGNSVYRTFWPKLYIVDVYDERLRNRDNYLD